LKQAGDLQGKLSSQREQRQRDSFDKVFSGGDETGFLQEIQSGSDATDDEKTATAKYNEGVREVRQRAEKYAFSPIDDAAMATVAKKAATLDFIMEHGMARLEAEYNKVVELNAAMAEKLKGLRASRQSGVASGDQSASGGEMDAMGELEAAFR
jgi:hypothetical protein